LKGSDVKVESRAKRGTKLTGEKAYSEDIRQKREIGKSRGRQVAIMEEMEVKVKRPHTLI